MVEVVEEEEGVGEVVEVRMVRAAVSYKYLPAIMEIEILIRNFSCGFDGDDLSCETSLALVCFCSLQTCKILHLCG